MYLLETANIMFLSFIRFELLSFEHGNSLTASHAEVWTFQFGWKFYQELTVTMVQVPKGTAVSTQGQHYVQ